MVACEDGVVRAAAWLLAAVMVLGTGCSRVQGRAEDAREKKIQACMAELNRQANDEGYPVGNARAACEASIPPTP